MAKTGKKARKAAKAIAPKPQQKSAQGDGSIPGDKSTPSDAPKSGANVTHEVDSNTQDKPDGEPSSSANPQAGSLTPQTFAALSNVAKQLYKRHQNGGRTLLVVAAGRDADAGRHAPADPDEMLDHYAPGLPSHVRDIWKAELERLDTKEFRAELKQKLQDTVPVTTGPAAARSVLNQHGHLSSSLASFVPVSSGPIGVARASTTTGNGAQTAESEHTRERVSRASAAHVDMHRPAPSGMSGSPAGIVSSATSTGLKQQQQESTADDLLEALDQAVKGEAPTRLIGCEILDETRPTATTRDEVYAQCNGCHHTGQAIGRLLIPCAVCGMCAYCSEECREADASEHSKTCDANSTGNETRQQELQEPWEALDQRCRGCYKTEEDTGRGMLPCFRCRAVNYCGLKCKELSRGLHTWWCREHALCNVCGKRREHAEGEYFCRWCHYTFYCSKACFLSDREDHREYCETCPPAFRLNLRERFDQPYIRELKRDKRAKRAARESQLGPSTQGGQEEEEPKKSVGSPASAGNVAAGDAAAGQGGESKAGMSRNAKKNAKKNRKRREKAKAEAATAAAAEEEEDADTVSEGE